jgi:hypothetical protein
MSHFTGGRATRNAGATVFCRETVQKKLNNKLNTAGPPRKIIRPHSSFPPTQPAERVKRLQRSDIVEDDRLDAHANACGLECNKRLIFFVPLTLPRN